jgi:hypothetical protein
LSCSLDVLYGSLGISKLHFMKKIYLTVFQLLFFSSSFAHQNPGSGYAHALTENDGNESALTAMRITNTVLKAGMDLDEGFQNLQHYNLSYFILHFALPCTRTDLFPLLNGEIGKDAADGLSTNGKTSNHSTSLAEGVHPFPRHSF